ncbi:MAG: flagellar motor protein MotB [Elusimicrobia bacterium]|nr:flagellar motor protein MotB [Elusimicrobiota bacterium]
MVPFLHRMAPSTLEENPLWLVVLCDMMTNLMLFFLMLYAYTRYAVANLPEAAPRYDTGGIIEPKARPGEAGVLEFQDVPERAERLRQRLRQAGLEARFEIEVTEREIRVRLRESLLFETGQAALAQAAEKTLGPLARVLGEMPNDVVIEGHTDPIPIVGGPYRTNWELSVARSYSVIAALVLKGVPARRLVASGYGELHPAADNSTVDGRGLNRRVEIVILCGEEDLDG